MEIIFNRPDHVYLENKRGLETVDANQLFLLIKEPVEPTSEFISKFYQRNIWQKNVYNQNIKIYDNITFVFQLVGHLWSILFLDFSRLTITENDVKLISQGLQANVIYYKGSDTSGSKRYLLYNNGTKIEEYDFEYGLTTKFESIEKKLDINDIPSGTVLDSLLSSRDAYIPSILWDYSPGECINFGGKDILNFTNLLPQDVIRMDCLS